MEREPDPRLRILTASLEHLLFANGIWHLIHMVFSLYIQCTKSLSALSAKVLVQSLSSASRSWGHLGLVPPLWGSVFHSHQADVSSDILGLTSVGQGWLGSWATRSPNLVKLLGVSLVVGK